MATKKILVIDDDPDFLEQTRLVLESDGYEVVTAVNGHEGIDKVASEKPDLTITDMMMETWTEGFTVVSKIRKQNGGDRMPLIVISAVDLHGPYQGYEPGSETPHVDLVLHKPVKPHDLLRQVKQLLN